MFLDSFTKNKVSNTPIGMLHAKDGATFVIEEVETKYSKRLTTMQQKTETKQPRQLTIKNNGTVFEPYEIAAIPLDLTQSSDVSNNCLLEYLGHAGNINNLILESILDINTINLIMDTPKYNNELTNNFLAINQNIFMSPIIIDKFSTKEKIRFFTENKYRNVENMLSHKEKFLSLIKIILENFLNDKEDLISENPSDMRMAIIKTCDEFYNKDISFDSIKKELLSNLRQNQELIKEEIESINIIHEALQKYKVTGENWQQKKQICKSLVEKLEEDANNKNIKTQIKIDVISNFPL